MWDKFSLLTPPPGTWGVLLNLDAPFMVPQAVQFAFFPSDPLEEFTRLYREKLPQVRAALRLQNPLLDREKEKQATTALLSTCWNQGFKNITGDAMNLLTSSPGNSQGGATCIFSSSTGGFHWLATKTITLADQTPICWCLPFYLEPGQKAELTLSTENYLDLTTLG
ncbi:MAG: hypothetical protein M0Z31_15675 [Clostridia bacterium]|nr:hypothetical protein [Clostridia bacterium]